MSALGMEPPRSVLIAGTEKAVGVTNVRIRFLTPLIRLIVTSLL